MKPVHQIVAALILALALASPGSFIRSTQALAMSTDAPATADSATALPGYKAAEALIKQEKYEEAIVELTALNKPDDADVLNLLGYSNRKLGKVDEGIVFYLKALEKNPAHKGVQEYLGEAYLMKSDLTNAEAIYTKLKDMCGFFGCDEASELLTQIEAFKKKQGS